MRLRIHNPCNEQTRYYRNYNLFWDELTDKLKEKYFSLSQEEELSLNNIFNKHL